MISWGESIEEVEETRVDASECLSSVSYIPFCLLCERIKMSLKTL